MISLLVRPRNLYPLRVKMKEEEKRQNGGKVRGPSSELGDITEDYLVDGDAMPFNDEMEQAWEGDEEEKRAKGEERKRGEKGGRCRC